MFEQLLKKIAQALDKGGIPYMIIGGQAVLLYGEPRLTRDIDIILAITSEKLDLVLGLAKGIGLRPLVDPENFTRKAMVLPCQYPKADIRVDFIFSFSPYERRGLERVRTVKIGGVRIKFASLEDLIIHKVIAGRPRDLEDVRSILIKNPGADLGHIRHWLAEFAASLEEPFVKRFDEVVQKIQ